MGELAKLFPLRSGVKQELVRAHKKLRTISEFFEDVTNALSEDHTRTIVDAVRGAAPWAGLVVDALGASIPPIKFLLKLSQGLVEEKDPQRLGLLACTLAYQRAVEQAVDLVPKIERPSPRVLKRAFPSPSVDSYRFDDFSLARAWEHSFCKDTKVSLEAFASGLGFASGSPENIGLQRDVQSRFAANLRGILCHGDTRQRFAPFRELIEAGSHQVTLRNAIFDHAETQRWLFEEHSVLGTESFSLARVYVEPDATQLCWEDICRTGEPTDPFNPALSREPLLDVVSKALTDPAYNDALLIQGPAGSGKSSFTLRLCAELMGSGLTPVRIELKHLDPRPGRRLCETLPKALEINSPARNRSLPQFLSQSGRYEQDFESLFDDSITYHGVSLCPYVLILDGLDELPLSGSHSYLERLREVLGDLEQAFLTRRDGLPIVRVVLVGRPSSLLADARFLKEGTRIVTLQPWDERRLAQFMRRVTTAQEARKQAGSGSWRVPPENVCQHLLERFRSGSEFAMLGSPLLAHLCLRLLGETAQVDGNAIVDELMNDPESLYRHIIDLVIRKAGKAPTADLTPRTTAMISGDDLRTLLQRTAEARSVLGVENIAHGELVLRLDSDASKLETHLERLEGKELISRLMISFFFKGGHEALGCEFAHKSFREYLFAEHIVELLKAYGRRVLGVSKPERQNIEFWRDFDGSDERAGLARELAEALGPQWLAPEVRAHIASLLRWEVKRAVESSAGSRTNSSTAHRHTTRACSLTEWCCIRDCLADLWDWWGEGVWLRPQPRRVQRTNDYEWGQPLAFEIARDARPRDTKPQPRPIRVVTVDAHLGDALCAITALVHWYLRFQSSPERRRYQVVDAGSLRFAPSGLDPRYFAMYCHRINAAGYRPEGEFPAFAPLLSVHLEAAALERTNFSSADLKNAILNAAVLEGANLENADLEGAHLESAYLEHAKFGGANLTRADLREAHLASTVLGDAILEHVSLGLADLEDANLDDARMLRAELQSANLRGARLRRAVLVEAVLYRADLFRADLQDADLHGANLEGANLTGADLTGAQLVDANLRGAELYGTKLGAANLRGADLTSATVTNALYSATTRFCEGFEPSQHDMKFASSL